MSENKKIVIRNQLICPKCTKEFTGEIFEERHTFNRELTCPYCDIKLFYRCNYKDHIFPKTVVTVKDIEGECVDITLKSNLGWNEDKPVMTFTLGFDIAGDKALEILKQISKYELEYIIIPEIKIISNEWREEQDD